MSSQNSPADWTALLGREGEPLAAALSKRGFESLTPVQLAVLDPALAGRDLRVSSQTGSGKTVAIGLAEAEAFDQAPDFFGLAALEGGDAETGETGGGGRHGGMLWGGTVTVLVPC